MLFTVRKMYGTAGNHTCSIYSTLRVLVVVNSMGPQKIIRITQKFRVCRKKCIGMVNLTRKFVRIKRSLLSNRTIKHLPVFQLLHSIYVVHISKTLWFYDYHSTEPYSLLVYQGPGLYILSIGAPYWFIKDLVGTSCLLVLLNGLSKAWCVPVEWRWDQ